MSCRACVVGLLWLLTAAACAGGPTSDFPSQVDDNRADAGAPSPGDNSGGNGSENPSDAGVAADAAGPRDAGGADAGPADGGDGGQEAGVDGSTVVLDSGPTANDAGSRR